MQESINAAVDSNDQTGDDVGADEPMSVTGWISTLTRGFNPEAYHCFKLFGNPNRFHMPPSATFDIAPRDSTGKYILTYC